MRKQDLDRLYAGGLLSPKVMNYFEIKQKVGTYQDMGMTKTAAARRVAELLGITVRSVWRALSATDGIELRY